MPDTAIVYKLHLECGRLINLFDLLKAFAAIVTESEASPTPVVQARFMRAMMELQMLGFVKTTKRKADHVLRLTWGAGV